MRECDKLYNQLILELSRQDEKYLRSNIAGSASELFFFVTHSHLITCGKSCDDDFDIFDQYNTCNQYEIFLNFPDNNLINWDQVRTEVTKFIYNHPNAINIAFDQICDMNFLSSMKINPELLNLIGQTINLVDDLKKIGNVSSYLFEKTQPKWDVIKKASNEAKNSYLKNNRRFPIGTHKSESAIIEFIDKIDKFKSDRKIIDYLAEQELIMSLGNANHECMRLINSAKFPIKLFLLRHIIGIDLMVSYNFDQMFYLSEIEMLD